MEYVIIIIVLALLISSFLAFAFAMSSSGKIQKKEIRKRLTSLGREIEEEILVEQEASQSLVQKYALAIKGLIEKYLPRNYLLRLQIYLEQAGLEIAEAELVMLHLIGICMLVLVDLLLLKNWYLVPLCMIVGTMIPTMIIKQIAAKRLKKFDALLLDTISLISTTIRSGFALRQALQVISDEMPTPIREEFGIVIQEINLGLSQEEALKHLNQRIPNQDLDLFITAVLIQSDIGGNLADILNKITVTIRERMKIKGEIRTLTAQGKMSGIMIGTLPFLIAAALMVINPGYMGILFTTQAGLMILGLALVMESVGAIVIKMIIRVDA